MDKYYIPQRLDEPFKIAMFTLGDIALFCIPFLIITFGFQKQILGLAVSIIISAIFKRLKGDENDNFIKHVVYWYLPPMISYKTTPPSYVREVIG